MEKDFTGGASHQIEGLMMEINRCLSRTDTGYWMSDAGEKVCLSRAFRRR